MNAAIAVSAVALAMMLAVTALNTQTALGATAIEIKNEATSLYEGVTAGATDRQIDSSQVAFGGYTYTDRNGDQVTFAGATQHGVDVSILASDQITRK